MSLKATRDPRRLPSSLSVHPTTRRVPRPLPFLLLLFAPFAFVAFLCVPRDTWVLPRALGAPRGPAQGARERGGTLAPGAGDQGWELERVALRAAAEERRGAAGPLCGCGRPSRPFESCRVLSRRPQTAEVLRAGVSANCLIVKLRVSGRKAATRATQPHGHALAGLWCKPGLLSPRWASLKGDRWLSASSLPPRQRGRYSTRVAPNTALDPRSSAPIGVGLVPKLARPA